MTFQQILRILLKRVRPVTYLTCTIFTNFATPEKPNPDQKLTLESLNIKNLTHDYMIKQSTVNAVNSASEALTITYTAIETTSKEYRYALSKLISLIEETLSHEVSDSHWDMIVATRSLVQEKKEIVTKLVGFMDYVQKMAVAASETTYLAGMDNLSTTLSQRIDDAINKIQKEVNQNKKLEDAYCHTQKECIVKCREHFSKPIREVSSRSPLKRKRCK